MYLKINNTMKFCFHILIIFFFPFLSSCAEDNDEPQEQVKQDTLVSGFLFISTGLDLMYETILCICDRIRPISAGYKEISG